MLYYRGVEEPPHHKFTLLNQTQMTVTFSRDLMIGMLRKGQTGDQLLQILDVIVPSQDEVNDVNEAELISA